MTDAVVQWMSENGVPLTRENYIELNWMGEPPDPWTAEAEEQLPEELRLGEAEPTHDAWEEREHPRKGKGPGGGEFTVKGSGSFGGGPTIHVHTSPQLHSAKEVAAALAEKHNAGLAEMPEPEHMDEASAAAWIVRLARMPKEEAAKLIIQAHVAARERGVPMDVIDSGLRPLTHWFAERQRAERKAKAEEGLPSAGGVGRLEAIIARNKAQHAAFVKSVEGARATIQKQGFRAAEMPPGMSAALEASDDLPKDPARVEAAANEYGNAVKSIRVAGLGALADEITKNVPVLFSSLKRMNPDPFALDPRVLDTSTLAMTVSGSPGGVGPTQQYVLINANSAPAGSWGIHDYSPALSVELVHWKGSAEDRVAFEMQGAIIHEFGHVLDNWSGARMTADLGRTLAGVLGDGWQTKIEGWLRANVSGYAASKPQEATAEAFYIAVVDGIDALPPELHAWAARWLAFAKSGKRPEPSAQKLSELGRE